MLKLNNHNNNNHNNQKLENFIDEDLIIKTLEATKDCSREWAKRIVARALEMEGLNFFEVSCLLNCDDPEVLEDIFAAARQIKDKIYGDRIVMFAPLYISNLCGNECLYCAFRATNKELARRALTQEEIEREVKNLVDQGHKRVLMVAGESYPHEGFEYVLKSIDTVYKVQSGNGSIRRVNVNIAPLEVEEFRQLKEKGIGTFQLFQETYHVPTYEKMHTGGKKKNFLWRLYAMDRAFQAGIDDVGIGVLFGLYDYKYEILALMQHIKHLEDEFGVGPHTISVPRLEPADGSSVSVEPPFPVTDEQFKKIVAILRIAVPYTGIIMSTRETPKIRRETFAVGVSQISAGSRTNPGGYSVDDFEEHSSQFSLGDHRALDEVINDLVTMKYIPSFCTACYRLGRTGHDFMDMAKPGDIKYHCSLNALSTLLEYLNDYASPRTKEAGEKLIREKLDASDDEKWKTIASEMLEQVKSGKRDCFI
ncbi:MAG: [FeFe] hydrogenase H-cluster radical SAM maturase HydG [Firmicutes bacterium]|nr:[FeFe] hydrogenase H-cluster radical SAM maturase HydG [Bacillota bacterium]